MARIKKLLIRILKAAFSWRLWVGLAPAILILLLLVWIGTWNVEQYFPGEKTMTLKIKNGLLIGREDGEKIWEIGASELVVSEDGDRTEATGIDRGIFYKDGQPQYYMTASKAVYTDSTEDLEVSGPIDISSVEDDWLQTSMMTYKGQLKKLIFPQPFTFEFGKTNFLKGASMEASKELEVMDVKGNVTLEITDFETPSAVGIDRALKDEGYAAGDMQIISLSAQRVIYDRKAGVITLMPTTGEFSPRGPAADFVTFRENDYTIRGRNMRVFKKEKTVRVEGGAHLERKGRETPEREKDKTSKIAEAVLKHDITLDSDVAIFQWANQDALMQGKVKFIQAADGKLINADSGTYTGRDYKLNLEGNVLIEMKSARWIAEAGVFDDVAPAERHETDKYLDKPTTISCRHVAIDTETGDMTAVGDVRVMQPKSVILASRLDHNARKDSWDMQGNVLIQNQEGEWVAAQSLQHNGEEEKTTIRGRVEIQFKMPPEYQEKLDAGTGD